MKKDFEKYDYYTLEQLKEELSDYKQAYLYQDKTNPAEKGIINKTLDVISHLQGRIYAKENNITYEEYTEIVDTVIKEMLQNNMQDVIAYAQITKEINELIESGIKYKNATAEEKKKLPVKVKQQAKELRSFVKWIKVSHLKKAIEDADMLEYAKAELKRSREPLKFLDVIDNRAAALLWGEYKIELAQNAEQDSPAANNLILQDNDKYRRFLTTPAFNSTMTALLNIGQYDSYTKNIAVSLNRKRKVSTRRNDLIDNQLQFVFDFETENSQTLIKVTTPTELTADKSAARFYRLIMQNILSIYDRETGKLRANEIFIPYSEIVEQLNYKNEKTAKQAFTDKIQALLKSLEIDGWLREYKSKTEKKQVVLTTTSNAQETSSEPVTDVFAMNDIVADSEMATTQTTETAIKDKKEKIYGNYTKRSNRSLFTGFDLDGSGITILLETRAPWQIFLHNYVYVPASFFTKLSDTAQQILIAIFTAARRNKRNTVTLTYRELQEQCALPNENETKHASRDIIEKIENAVDEIEKQQELHQEQQHILFDVKTADIANIKKRIDASRLNATISKEYMDKASIYTMKEKQTDEIIKAADKKTKKSNKKQGK